MFDKIKYTTLIKISLVFAIIFMITVVVTAVLIQTGREEIARTLYFICMALMALAYLPRYYILTNYRSWHDLGVYDMNKYSNIAALFLFGAYYILVYIIFKSSMNMGASLLMCLLFLWISIVPVDIKRLQIAGKYNLDSYESMEDLQEDYPETAKMLPPKRRK